LKGEVLPSKAVGKGKNPEAPYTFEPYFEEGGKKKKNSKDSSYARGRGRRKCSSANGGRLRGSCCPKCLHWEEIGELGRMGRGGGRQRKVRANGSTRSRRETLFFKPTKREESALSRAGEQIWGGGKEGLRPRVQKWEKIRLFRGETESSLLLRAQAGRIAILKGVPEKGVRTGLGKEESCCVTPEHLGERGEGKKLPS